MKYFGTDGIRRIANTELTPELVYKVAKAGAYVLAKHSNHAPTILIGRDTRISGTLIESAMTAGFLSKCKINRCNSNTRSCIFNKKTKSRCKCSNICIT